MSTRPAHYNVRPREDLTPRQCEVLDLIARGYTNAQIAERLGIGFESVKTHVSEILLRLGVDSREEAAEAWRYHTSLGGRFRRALNGIAWLWSGKAGVAAAAVVVAAAGVAALVLVLPGGTADPAATEPGAGGPTPAPTATPTLVPAVVPPAATTRSDYVMRDLGTLFVSEDGRAPVADWEAREAAVVVTLNDSARIRLKTEHVEWRLDQQWVGGFEATAFIEGTRYLLFVRSVTDDLTVTPAPGDTGSGTLDLDFRSSQPVLVLRVSEWSETPLSPVRVPAGFASAAPYHVNVGRGGQLYLSTEPVVDGTVIDLGSGASLDTRGARFLGRLEAADHGTHCNTEGCSALWHKAVGMPLRAPWTGQLRCTTDGPSESFIDLDSPDGATTVRFKKMGISEGGIGGRHLACDPGVARWVNAGEVLAEPELVQRVYGLTAFGRGQAYSVGISVDGQVVVWDSLPGVGSR